MKQGEIWYIDFNPTIGKEINKIRPAVIIDDDYLASCHMRFVMPLTTWQDKFADLPWIKQINPNKLNGLKNISGINVQQARYISTQRFVNQVGTIDIDSLNDIHAILIKLINPNLKII